jgi:hypothetical protein
LIKPKIKFPEYLETNIDAVIKDLLDNNLVAGQSVKVEVNGAVLYEGVVPIGKSFTGSVHLRGKLIDV